MKRWKKEQQKQWKSKDANTIEWLEWTDRRVNDAIEDCIHIVQNLHDAYDKYYERQALMNVIRFLEMYENGEDIDV